MLPEYAGRIVTGFGYKFLRPKSGYTPVTFSSIVRDKKVRPCLRGTPDFTGENST